MIQYSLDFSQLLVWNGSVWHVTGLFFLDVYELFVKQTKSFKQWAVKMVKCGLVDKDVLPDFDNVYTALCKGFSMQYAR